MIFRIKLLAIFFFFASNHNAQWTIQESGTSRNLTDVCFIDSLHGWIVAEKATILTTTDGGDNWIRQTSPIDTVELNKVEFVDTDNGFIVGEKGVFLNTIDGGNTWELVENSFDYNFSDLSFVDADNGWVSGWQETSQERIGVILHTNDRGVTWTKQIEKIADYLFGSTIFIAVQFWDDNNGWAFGGDYADALSATYVYHTKNGGRLWEVISVFESGPLQELNVVSATTLWGSKNQFISSNNSGYDWHFNPDIHTGSMKACSPVDSLHGWIYSYDFNKNTRQVLFTVDGGLSWDVEIDLESSVNAMDVYGDNYLWIVGSSGLIMKRVGNITSINANSLEPSDYHLAQNYPNPFNPSTIINYSILEQTHVELKVYDVLGREVANLVDKEQSAGRHEVQFDASGLGSGVYFYHIRAGEFVQSKKMILLK